MIIQVVIKMSKAVNVFLPMRAGSQRVPNKNTKSFGGIDGGLCSIKLEQLLKCRLIDSIFVSTNDPKVMDICNRFNSQKIKIIERPEELASSATSTDDLIKYVPAVMPDGHILWTHVTSPFITPDIYDQIIGTYLSNIEYNDSLMTVTKLQKFIWNNTAPINYNHSVEKWPRTQTLEPLWEVNSGAFLTTREIYLKHTDRIGSRPYLYQLNAEISFDIDWLPDFNMAEAMFQTTKNRNSKVITDSHLQYQGKTYHHPPPPLPPEGLLWQPHYQPLHPVD